MKKRDIVRARVTSTDPMVRATTKSEDTLGVLHAICPSCGEPLHASDSKPDFNVACNRCDYTGYRVLSSDFNRLNGLDSSNLNREGTRWSSEAEGMLGHDARVHIFPLLQTIEEDGRMRYRDRLRDRGRDRVEIAPGEKCMMRNVPSAAMTPRYHSNQRWASRSVVENASN